MTKINLTFTVDTATALDPRVQYAINALGTRLKDIGVSFTYTESDAPTSLSMRSRTTDQGTAMAEASLCVDHYIEPFIGYADVVADGADDVGHEKLWAVTTGNEAIRCVECGRDTFGEIDPE